MKTPSVTPGVIAAGVAAAAQLTGIPQEAADNITTLAVAAAASDTVVRVSRAKWVAKLMADRDKDGRIDVLQNMPLAWFLAIGFSAAFVGVLTALLLVLFV